MIAFSSGQPVQVYSSSSSAWVDALVVDVLEDATVRVQYGASQKLIRPELQAALLRQRVERAPPAGYPVGQAVDVFSKSGGQWVAARVQEVLADGALRVQYTDAKHLFKVIPAHLQACAMRASTARGPPEAVAGEAAAPDAGRGRPGARRGGAPEIAEGCPQHEAPRRAEGAPEGAEGCRPREAGGRAAPAGGGEARPAGAGGAAAAAAVGAGHGAEEAPRRARSGHGLGVADGGGSTRHGADGRAGGPRLARSRSRSPRAGPARGGTEDLVEVVPASARSAPCGSAVPALRLPRSLCDGLWAYQKEGVAWMWGLYHARQGGVLADEMGLGKTVQACACVQAVRAAGARHALVLVPVTLLSQWAAEIQRWCPECPVYVYHGSAAQRGRALDAVRLPRGGVLLTSYNIVKNESEHLLGASVDSVQLRSGPGGVERRRVSVQKNWDIMICDEAHVMRSISTLLGKAVRNICSNCRILLTGTPVQNRLQDMWALMDFAQPGLLGNHATFTKRFSEPIEKGSVRSAGPSAVALKKHLCDQLLQLVAPHLLRRTKESTGLQGSDIGDPAALAVAVASRGCSEVPFPKSLPPKVELVVWLAPTTEQAAAYKQALATSEVIREANDKTRLGLEVFKAIGLLKRLCNHPALGLPVAEPGLWQEVLSVASASLPGAGGCFRAACPQRRGPPKPSGRATPSAATMAAASALAPPLAVAADDPEDDAGAAGAGGTVERLLRKLPRDLDSLVAQSAKLRCVAAMLPALIARGHRVLIFSQGVLMMDLIEVCVLRKQGISFLRLDGHTDIKTRAERVASFQAEPEKYKCMLLTTRVGGYGLNLTGADRVILLDPAWNPASDAQAVDRAYRIGQQNEVRTYRLVMSGLIEDKMFRLQVFKMGLTNSALEASQQHRYFTQDEIRALFKWADPAKGETMRLIAEKHSQRDGDLAAEHAQVDGAQDGWLQAGPAIGLSVFSSLFRALAPEEPQEEDGLGSEEVREMRARISRAEQESVRQSEARAAAEGQVAQAQLGAQEAAGQIASAAEDRARAGQRLKAAHSELARARREEAASERVLEKAVQAQAAAQKHLLGVEERRRTAGGAEDAVARQCEGAGEALAATEQTLAQALADTSCRVERVCGTSGSGLGDPSAGGVCAPGAAASAARKAIERAQKCLDAARAAREAAQRALGDLLNADARQLDSEAEANVAAARQEPQQAAAVKAAQVAASSAGKESARAEKAFEKAAKASAGAQERASQTVHDLKEAVSALAESLQGDGATLVRDVRSMQQELRASARGVAAAWQAARAAQQACCRAEGLRRRAARAAAASCAEVKEARARGLAADDAHARAEQEAAAVQLRRRACESEVEEARAAGVDAEMRGVGQKRRREELKAELAGAKQGLKAAKAAEKEAICGRDALYKHYAKGGDGAKDEAASAGSAAGAAAEERQRAVEAIQALKGEVYDANQVVEAYESKRRRVEADPDAA